MSTDLALELREVARAGSASGIESVLLKVLKSGGASARDRLVNLKLGGQSALMICSWHGFAECVSVLLAHGADANDSDHLGDSCLMKAALHGHIEVVEILIKKSKDKINIDHANNVGNTALSLAVLHTPESHSPEIVVNFLLLNGANPNKCPALQPAATLIHMASSRGRWAICDALLCNGANFSIVDVINTIEPGFIDIERNYYLRVKICEDHVRKWPMAMLVLVFQELGIFHIPDAESFFSFSEYISDSSSKSINNR